MNFLRILTAATLVAVVFHLPKALAEPSASQSFSRDACGAGESWTFSPALEAEWSDAFNRFLKGSRSPVIAFSEGLALRRFGSTEEAKFFGEYWVSRALNEAKLAHVAWNGFSAMVARTVSAEQLGIQLAALSCLLEIQARTPAMAFTGGVALRLPELAQGLGALSGKNLTEAKRILQQAASARIRELVSEEKPSQKVGEALLSILKDAGADEFLSKGLWAARRAEHRNTISWLRKFLEAPPSKHLERYRDQARILLGRAHFSTGEFEASLNILKTVTRNSNELAHSLSDLAWAQLLEGRHSEAIGTAVALRAGGLRNTFTPETPMVMSMAMNEICQYPQSVLAIQSFQKKYEVPHRWLSAWIAKPTPLYPHATRFLRKSPDAPPMAVASDWVRSPLFIAFQDEINLLFDEKDSARSLGRSGSEEQKKLTGQIIQFVRELKPKLKLAKMQQKEGQSLPARILNDLAFLKHEMLRLRRLRQAAPIWQMILSNHLKLAPLREARLVAGINEDLNRRTRMMYYQLEEIAENLQLVEVEIYNGASQDIIWQNAHPDYKKVAQGFTEEKRSAQKVWDWGRVVASSGDSEAGEIWEDELGSFKAAVFDNCSSKDRYLALKMKRGKQ